MNGNFLVVIFYVEKAKNGMFLGIKTPPGFSRMSIPGYSTYVWETGYGPSEY